MYSPWERKESTMPKKGRMYPPEFRRQMVELVRAGRTAEELSREFEPSAQAIRNWVKQAELDEGKRADGLTSREKEELERLIHHSDRGVQYLSIRYTERLAEAGIEPSVGSKGDSYDNAL